MYPNNGKVWYLREGEVDEEPKVNYRELWGLCEYCKEQFDRCLEDNYYREYKDKCFFYCENQKNFTDTEH